MYEDVSSYGDNTKRSMLSRQPTRNTVPIPQHPQGNRPAMNNPTTYSPGRHEVDHKFDFGGAFKLGLGFGLGIMIALPIGLIAISIMFTVFGATLVGFVNGLG